MANNGGNNAPQSLGSPLVKVSTARGSGIRPSTGGIVPPPPPAASAVPVGSDHPLAHVPAPPPPKSTMPTPPPLLPNPAVSLRERHVPQSAFQSPPNQPPVQQPQHSTPAPPQPHAAASPASTQYYTPAGATGTPNTPGFVTPTPQDQSSPPVQIMSHPVSPKNTLDALADAFMAGPSYRNSQLGLPPLLKPPPLPSTTNGILRLRTLVERRAWGDVLQISGDMLRSTNSTHCMVYNSLMQGNTDKESSQQLQKEVVEILTLECHAWLKLRRYADLGREVERWSFSRTNDITAIAPDWCDFSLQILAATSLVYTDTMAPNRAIDELYSLKETLEDSQLQYKLTINAALSNIFIRQKEWRLSLQALEEMLQVIPQVYSHDQVLADAFKMDILSRQGRTLLQIGALGPAEEVLKQANDVKTPNLSPHWVVSKVPVQAATNEGLLLFAQHKYNEALAAFKQASDLLRVIPDSVQGYHVEAFVGPTLWVETPQSIMTQVFNNMSLSALYTCRMKEAVRTLEALVREDPTAYLTERLAFNLCTLYELGADTAASARKKRVLQLLAKRFYLHDIGPEQFRVG